MAFNNLYNFKNPVRDFIDIDSLKLPDDKYRILKRGDIL